MKSKDIKTLNQLQKCTTQQLTKQLPSLTVSRNCQQRQTHATDFQTILADSWMSNI